MIGPMPTAPGGFNRILVAIDMFTKWIKVKPVICPKADRVLDFLDELVHQYGLPHRIITDLGPNFNNHQFWEYCENGGIDVRYVSVAHPRANRQVERANGMVLDALKKRLHDATNTKGGKWIMIYPTHSRGFVLNLPSQQAVALLPSRRLQSYSTRRRDVGIPDSRTIRQRHLRRQQTGLH
jgi:hypothetical protein